MISDNKGIDGLIEEISRHLESPTHIFILGGGALMYMDMKACTKDVDCVVRTRAEYEAVSDALLQSGFRSIRPGAEYARMNLSNMFERDDGARVDLFEDRVLRKAPSVRWDGVPRHREGGPWDRHDEHMLSRGRAHLQVDHGEGRGYR